MTQIDVKKLFLIRVIGRRGIGYTASSLWPCQKQYLNVHKKIVNIMFCLILLITIGYAVPAICADTQQLVPPNAAPAPAPAAPNAPAPMTDIHDIRPPVPVGVDIPPWLVPVLIALVVVGLLAALFFWWCRHRKNRDIETIVPELPPETIAIKALDEISDVRGQDGKAFYFRLSAILRQYIFGRFGVGAPEMTTEEFLPCVEKLPADRDLARQLKQLCRAMDPVKFAGQRVDEKQMEEDLFFVRGFVRQTTQEPIPETPPQPSVKPPALPPAEGKR